MVWGYSGNVYQNTTNGQMAEAFGFEYLRVGSNPRSQGRAGHDKMRIGLCGDKCKMYATTDTDTEDVEHIRIASVSTKMIPAAIRLFTSFDLSAGDSEGYFLGLAYPATREDQEADTGQLVGYSNNAIMQLYQKYLGRIYADVAGSATDTTTTTKSKDEERMLTTWPQLGQTTISDYEEWTLGRYNRSIEEIWALPEVQNNIGAKESPTLPAYLDIVFITNGVGATWDPSSFFQFNCTFVGSG